MKNQYFTKGQFFGLILGLIGGFLLFIFPVAPENLIASRTAAIVFLMASWWLTEAIPIAATSLIPLVLFPLLGILSAKQVSNSYINNIIFLFIGAFMIAITVEKWDLHRRISIKLIKTIGNSPARMLLALMLASWLLSMLINNTSTTMLMLPIALSIILQMEETNDKQKVKNFAIAMLLGIAYASSIGGIATLVGTVPNLVFARIFEMTFPAGPKINFSTWMMTGMPISVIMLVVAWLILKFSLLNRKNNLTIDSDYIIAENKKLGKMSYEEKVVSFLLLALTLLWIFRVDLKIGTFTITGWSDIFTFGKMFDDSTIAIGIAALLFLIPSRSKKGKFLADNTIFKGIPWHIIILFGGGFAVADAFKETELAEIISSNLTFMSGIHPIIIIMIISALLMLLTELTSNTATTQTILPILAATAIGMHINPLLLMVPATISASMAFMLPVATPPNAIVFGSGRLKIYEMARIGVMVNFSAMVVISLMFYYLGMFFYNINPNSFPWWAQQ